MKRGSARLFWMGLAVSVLLHAGLLSTGLIPFPLAGLAEDPPAFEARLEEPAPQAVEPPPPRGAEARPQAIPPPRAPVPQAPEPSHPAEQPEAAAPAEATAVVPLVAQPEGQQPVASQPAVVPAAEAPARLNPLPRRLDIEYRLSYGPASGRQTLVWVGEGERYTLSSVATATGLTSLFYSGRFAQTSRGRITPRGLQPEEFWDQRGDRHSSARFDAALGQITLMPAKGAPRHFSYAGEVQDALSLLVQFALTAPPAEPQQAYTVFNGKKLRDYRYEVRGEATLETALGALRTLHLARVGGEGRFEVWLAVDRHYLPVRVLRAEESGAEGELAIRSIRIPE